MTGPAPGARSSTVSCTTLISLIGSLNPTAEGQIDIQPANVIRLRQLGYIFSKALIGGVKISGGWFPCNLFRQSFLPCHNQAGILVIKAAVEMCRTVGKHADRLPLAHSGCTLALAVYFIMVSGKACLFWRMPTCLQTPGVDPGQGGSAILFTPNHDSSVQTAKLFLKWKWGEIMFALM